MGQRVADPSSFLVADGGAQTHTFTYDAENRLVTVSGATSGTFVYAPRGPPDNQRVKGTVGGVTTFYVGKHYEVEGGVIKKYYYAGDRRIAMRSGGALYPLLGDHLGSTAYTLNAASEFGEVRYKAFGATRFTSGTTPTTYRRVPPGRGQREESALGLYYYGARWYDPALGRFIQADTIVPDPADARAYDRYAYVLNNPLRYTDPTGHQEECPEQYQSKCGNGGGAMGGPPAGGGGGRIGGPGPNSGGGFFSRIGSFFKRFFGYGEEEVQLRPVATPAPSLAPKYSNVSTAIQKPLLREVSANAGNSVASRLDEIPAYGIDWGGKATTKTLGILEVPGRGDVYLQSGYDGPIQLMPDGRMPGMNIGVKGHVESHTAAIMRLEGIDQATLYLNRAPCGGATGCEAMLSRMLPPGATLTVIAPGYQHSPFVGVSQH